MATPEHTRFAIDGEPHWREATAGGRGAVLVTAHLGPWEIVDVFGRRGRTPDRARRARRGDRSASRRRSSARWSARIRRSRRDALRRRRPASRDRDWRRRCAAASSWRCRGIGRARAGGRSRRRSSGSRCRCPSGLWRWRAPPDVPLLPVFSFREGVREGRTVIRPPITIARTADREADLGGCRRISWRAEIEWAIRERPHQWFCFRKLWENWRDTGGRALFQGRLRVASLSRRPCSSGSRARRVLQVKEPVGNRSLFELDRLDLRERALAQQVAHVRSVSRRLAARAADPIEELECPSRRGRCAADRARSPAARSRRRPCSARTQRVAARPSPADRTPPAAPAGATATRCRRCGSPPTHACRAGHRAWRRRRRDAWD